MTELNCGKKAVIYLQMKKDALGGKRVKKCGFRDAEQPIRINKERRKR